MATLTLEEFLPKARQLNPGYSDDEHIQAYEQRYGRSKPVQTVSAAPLTTYEQFLPKARALNPEYSDEEHYAAWQEKYGARGAKERDLGFSGTFVEGAKSTGRSLKAAAQTATGNLRGVEDTAAVPTEKDPALQKILADIQIRTNALGKDPSWWQSIKSVGGAVVDNPKGAAMLATEQLPNSAVALGSAGAGALAGSALGPAGTIAGGIAGLFLGNTAIETGSKAISKAGDGFTPEERAQTLQEGGVKGGVVTGFDVLTFGLTKWLTGTVARAMERATINVLQREGIDTTNKAAVQAARQNPEIVAKVQQAQETARAATNTLSKKLARGAGEVGSEAIGEGAGEYIGEVAATGKGDKVEAVIEALSGLGQSGAEIAVAQGMSRKQQQQGSFGDVTGQPIVTERTPEDMGVKQPDVLTAPRQIEGPIQPGEVRGGKIYAPGDVLDVSPLPDVRPVTGAATLDDAIAGAFGIVRGATETAKSRAAEFARMTAKAKNETDALLAKAPEKRPAFEVPTLPGPEAHPSALFNQPPSIVPGQAFTPRPQPVDDPRARLAEERARIVAQREQQRVQQQNPVSEPVAPVQAVEPADTSLTSQVDLAYPSSKQVRDLIHEKGLHLDTPVFRDYLKMAVGKEKFSDLTPQELQTLADKVQKIKAPQSPTQSQEVPPQVPLTPAEPKERPYAPVTTIPEAQVPRSELTPEKNAEILLRAEKAKADMEIAGTERGGRFFQDQPGAGSTQEVTGLKSATADWYKELTSGPSPAIRGDRKQSAREKIEVAIAKIIKDKGADRGKAVEQVKAALLQDTEFHQTEWGRDLNSILQGEWPSWVEKPQGVTQATENAKEFQNVPRSTPKVTVEEPKKVPLSRKERLAQQKQKMEGERPVASGATPLSLSFKDETVASYSGQTNHVLRAESTDGKSGRLEYSVYDGDPNISFISVPDSSKRSGIGSALVRELQRKFPDREIGWGMTTPDGTALKDSLPFTTVKTEHYEQFKELDRVNARIAEIKRRNDEAWDRGETLSPSEYDTLNDLNDKAYDLRKALERKAPTKQILSDKKPEPLPSEAPGMEPRPATASPEREPAPSTAEAAPKREEPFSLSSPEVSKPEAKEQGLEQLSIDVPPPTVGERPIIGREATFEEAPLFSKNAQEKDPEQISLDRATIPDMATDRGPGSSGTAQTPPEPGRVNANSKEFKKWFGKSVVTDGNGEPLVVYHGSHSGLRGGEWTETLSTKSGVATFTSDKKIAENYSNGMRPVGENNEFVYSADGKFNGTVLRAYLRIENPITEETTLEEVMGSEDEAEETRDLGIYASGVTASLDGLGDIEYIVSSAERSKPFRDYLVKQGYDGFIFPDQESGGTTYIPFIADQIKSLPNSSIPQQGGLSVTPTTTASEPIENPDESPVIPKQDSGSSAQSPTEIIADALRTAADKIEGKKEPKVKEGNLTDVGEELWYNKRNRAGKGIVWNDVKDLNATLKVKEVTKTRVWPRPDYEQLVEDGMHPFTAHLVKQIYDSIATAPSTNSPTDDKLQTYIETVQKLRESVFSWVKNIQQQRDILDRMAGQAGAERSAETFGSPVQISSLMKSTDYSIIRQVWPSPEGVGAFRDQKNKESLWIVGGNKLFGALQPGYDEAKRAISALKEGWPAQQEAWQKRFTIKEVPVGEKIYSREGARTLTEPEFWIMRKSKAGRFGNIVETGLKTREEAIEKAKSLAERKEKDGGEEEVPLNLEGLQRVGVERRAKGENISPAAFKDAFGFRGVNFGNWTNQIERQAHVNLAYDALMDMADVLGIPPKAVSLDGLLGVAFGAQGSGKYAAHFVPGVNEINLTKTRGAGALAHEWAHAVDHYFAVQAGEKYAKSTDPFLTHLSQVQSATIRPEVVDAFKTIVKTMKQRDQTAEEIKQGYSEKLARAEKGLRSWTDTIEKRIPEEKRGPVSKLIERIKMGDVGDGYVKAGRDSAFRTRIHELREAYKVAMGHLLPKEEAQAIQNWGNSLEFARKAQSPQGHIPQKSTSYLINAEKFDKDKGGKEYWTQPTEIFARAFQSYVMDRLEAKAERNDYLTRPQKEGSLAYPQGEERTAINAAFDSLVGVLQTKETDKGVALYQKDIFPDPSPEEAETVQKAIEGKTVLQAAQFIAQSAPSPSHRLIAGKVEAQLKRLQLAGMTFELHVAHEWDRVPNLLGRARGLTWLPPNSLTAQVWIQGADVTGYVGTSYETVLHELIHAATQAAIEVGQQDQYKNTEIGKSVARVVEVSDRVIDHFNERFQAAQRGAVELTPFEKKLSKRYANALDDPGETVAWALSNHEMQKYLESVPYEQESLWTRFVNAIREFLGLQPAQHTALSEVLRVSEDILHAPVNDIMPKFKSVWMPSRVNQYKGLLNAQQSIPGMEEPGSLGEREQPTGTIDPPTAREKLHAAGRTLRPYLLGALGLEQLSQVYGNDHAEVKAYNKATQAMEADFTKMSRDSDKIARAWTDLKIPVADKMAQVMEDARFLNFDPDPKKNQEADSPKKQALVTRFDQLPEDAKVVYRMARDFYTNMAEQRFQALKERIERAGGTPENTRKLVDRLQIAYEKVRSKVYFPFSRFGENIVIAKKMDGLKELDREVHAFESVAEAQKFATMMKLKGWQVKQTVAREYSVDKEGPASKIVREMHDIIKELGQGQQGLPGVMDLEHQLLDALNQSFLQALPDMSYAKHFIHAKDVKGASKDALRAFAHSALHGAHHISRIRHADKVTNALMDLDNAINATVEGDTTEARQVYNELVKRHNDIMNPNTHPFSAWLGQLGFTMSLGGVVATGITNATQVPLVTYPWLGARYGFGKASAALARAYKDFLDPRTLNKDSLFDATKSKLISESERKMLLELAKRGHIDLTQTMDLAGLSSRDNLSRKARTLGTVGEKVTRMLGFTFHVPEAMNRQVTALSTFRLEKEKGSGFEEALERAQQAIQDTHFIYQSHNRPRYMQGNFLRVLTMFKQYSQNIAYTYGRAAAIWLDKNGATKEERTVAKRQLASMLVLQFGAAGALGMPFFGTPISLVMTALGAMGDDDEKKDWEVALRKWLDGQATSLAEAFMDDKEQAGKVGKEMAEVVSHGASRLTPWDMAGRLGQNDLFVREPQREREGRAAVFDWMMALGGPVPSYGVNTYLGLGDVWKGMTELNGGFFMRGVEELMPAVLRNGVKSLRYTLEGVRTRDEYKQLELSTSEELGQVFGFTPSRVAEMYESTTAIKNKEHRILNQQKALKDRFARAVDDQDDSAKQRILEDIRGFNERNPIFAITSDTLNRSLKARRQHEAGMERGLYLPPRRRALLEEGDWADF